MKIKYIEKKTLECRGAVAPEPDEDVDGILLVAEKSISLSPSGHIRYGHDGRTIRPAIYNGARAWLLACIWQPARGYCASGTTECIISFEDGVKQLIDSEYFSFPIPITEEDGKDEIVRDGVAHHRHGGSDYYHPVERVHKEEGK